MIKQLEQKRLSRQLEMNYTIQLNLEKIIATLEEKTNVTQT